MGYLIEYIGGPKNGERVILPVLPERIKVPAGRSGWEVMSSADWEPEMVIYKIHRVVIRSRLVAFREAFFAIVEGDDPPKDVSPHKDLLSPIYAIEPSILSDFSAWWDWAVLLYGCDNRRAKEIRSNLLASDDAPVIRR